MRDLLLYFHMYFPDCQRAMLKRLAELDMNVPMPGMNHIVSNEKYSRSAVSMKAKAKSNRRK